MAVRTITTRLKLEGESEHRAALKRISSEYQLHKSELDKVSAQYKEQANTLSALEGRQAALKGIVSDLSARHAEQAAILEKAQKAQQEYAGTVDELQKRLSALGTASGGSASEQKQLEAELAKAERKLQEAGNAVNYYQRQLNNTEKAQATFGSQMEKTEGYLEEARRSADGCAVSIDQFGKKVKQAGEESEQFGSKSRQALETMASVLAAAGINRALGEIAGELRECVDASLAFESTMAGVQRTVGGSETEIAAMGDSFKEMSTQIPITTNTLGKIAETAGQLGVARGDVEAFTQVMAMLDTTTDLTAESAATMLAQFANITGLTDYERLGAVVAELGDATATTASKVVEMAQGMAATGTAAGMSERNILAISAAVGSLGIEAQAGSTAMSTLISTLHKAVETGSDSLRDFASVAGMSAEQFAAAWRSDAAGALEAFIAGLNDTERNGRSAIVILDELGITNARQVKAIQGLANAGDLLSGTIAQANQAWESNTALAEKAGIMYETTEAKLTMAGNAANNLKTAIGDTLSPALGDLAEKGTEGFTWAAEFVEENPWLVQALTGAAGAVGLLAGGLTAYAAVSKAAKLVQDELNLSMSLCPAIAVAAALGALGTVLVSYAASARKANDETSGLSEALREAKGNYEDTTASIQAEQDSISSTAAALEELAAVEEKSAGQKGALLSLVEQLNTAIPNLNLAYDQQTDSLNMTTEAIKRMALAQAEQQKREEAQSYLSALYIEQQRLTELQAAAVEDLARAEAELNEARETLVGNTEEENNELIKLQTVMGQCKQRVAEYTAQLEAAESEIIQAESAYAELTGQITEDTSALEENAQAVEESRTVHMSLADILDQTKDAYELLAKAQGEVQESGSLSIETLQTLISQYPALTRYLQETADGYILTENALQDYLSAQQAQYQTAYDNAASAAQAVIEAETAKRGEFDATTGSIRDQIRALAALYQAKAAQASFGADWKNNDDFYAHGASAMGGNADWRTGQEYQRLYENLMAAERELEDSRRVSAMLARDYGSSGGSSSRGGGSSAKRTGSAKDGPSAQEQALEELDEWLEDMDHKIFLWSKDARKSDAVLGLYEQMQEKVHALADTFRKAGLEDSSGEIQQLQRLWWGYADQMERVHQEVYRQEVEALKQAYSSGDITLETYLDGRQRAVEDHLKENTSAWETAGRELQEARRTCMEDLYREELADQKYFLDMGLITEDEYYQAMARLRDQYLEADSDAWRDAQVRLHQYQTGRLEELKQALEQGLEQLERERDSALKELEQAYRKEDSALQSEEKAESKALEDSRKEKEQALKDQYKAEKALREEQYRADKEALNRAYKDQKAAAKEAYEAKKAAIQQELSLEQERLEGVLAGIDAEVQARRRLREDEDLDEAVERARKSLEAAKAQRDFARSDEDRAEWEKEVLRRQEDLEQAVQNRDDTLFYREKDAEKQAFQDQLDGVREAAKRAQEEASAEYQETLERLEQANAGALERLQKEYEGSMSYMEAEHSGALERLEAEHESALERVQRAYALRLEEAQRDYERSAQAVRERYEQDAQRAQEQYAGALEQAQTGYAAALGQAQEAYTESVAEAARRAAQAWNGAVSQVGRKALQEVSYITNRANSAVVHIHEARAMTEGEVRRTVKKVLDTLDR